VSGPTAGTVFVTDLSGQLYEIAPNGTQSIISDGFNLPAGLATDPDGDLYVADEANNRVVEMRLGASPFTPTTLTGLSDPVAVAVDATHDVFVADTGNSRVLEYPDGGGAPETVLNGHDLLNHNDDISHPGGVAVNESGDVYIADTGNNRVLECTPEGNNGWNVTVVASGLDGPTAVAVDSSGDVYIAEMAGNEVVEAKYHNGTFTSAVEVGKNLNAPDAIAVDSSGNVYISDEDALVEVRANGSQTTVGTGLFQPVGVAVYLPSAPAIGQVKPK
jgi:streptogramin lyase